MKRVPWCVSTRVDDLEEGLFGQVLLWVFEILPWLQRRGLRPQWDVRSRLYGVAPHYRVLPGVFDLVEPPGSTDPTDRAAPRPRSLLRLRIAHSSTLCGDWPAMHALWSSYFRVPARIQARADAVGLPPNCLGLHYRGTDKNRAPHDTNPLSREDFLALVEAFLAERPGIEALFLATDEPGLLARVGAHFPGRRVIGLGDIDFHKLPAAGPEKADRALLDCVLLSRCAVVLKCSSALSAFAKVLEPKLECYRLSACKMFCDIPYFPDAYIPRLVLQAPAARALLERQFAGDWLDDERARRRWHASPGGPKLPTPRYTPARIAWNAMKYAARQALRSLRPPTSGSPPRPPWP